MSGVPETGVTFFKFGGHNHDGVNSTEINTSNYSIFDFGTGIGTQNGDTSREISRSLNQIRFNGYIANFISSQILAPAGIVLSENSVTGRTIGAREISADKIVANTITANEIQANTITANQISANAITASELNANAVVAGKIAAGVVTATEIAAGTITANNLVADISLINNVIRSQNYVAGSAGWKIANTGTVEFSSGTFRGTISAAAGTIGGWTIASDRISAGNTILYANGDFVSGIYGVTDLSFVRNGTSTLIGGSQSGVVHGGATISNSSLTNGDPTTGPYKLDVAGYMKSLSGKLGPLNLNLGNLSGTSSFVDGTKFSVGSKSAGSITLDGPNGQIIFGYNSSLSATIGAGLGGLFYAGALHQFNTPIFNIINSAVGGSVALNIDLPAATVGGLVSLGIDSAGNVSRMTSKRSAKYDINTFDNSISLLKQLNPVIYKWRSNALESDLVKFLKDNDPRYGFILEDVEAVSPHLISYHYEGPKGLLGDQMFSDPSNFTPSMFDANGILSIVTGALKESVARIESLEDTVLSMSSRIDSLEQLVGG
jgi:hypothetical protein